jgi:hypothetical protein
MMDMYYSHNTFLFDYTNPPRGVSFEHLWTRYVALMTMMYYDHLKIKQTNIIYEYARHPLYTESIQNLYGEYPIQLQGFECPAEIIVRPLTVSCITSCQSKELCKEVTQEVAKLG